MYTSIQTLIYLRPTLKVLTLNPKLNPYFGWPYQCQDSYWLFWNILWNWWLIWNYTTFIYMVYKLTSYSIHLNSITVYFQTDCFHSKVTDVKLVGFLHRFLRKSCAPERRHFDLYMIRGIFTVLMPRLRRHIESNNYLWIGYSIAPKRAVILSTRQEVLFSVPLINPSRSLSLTFIPN